jgi:hypothetical protein
MEKRSRTKCQTPMCPKLSESKKRTEKSGRDEVFISEEELAAIEGFILPQVLKILQRKQLK